MKYSYVPQTEAPYKLDRTSPEIDWNVSEPEKVSFITLNRAEIEDGESLGSILQGVLRILFVIQPIR